jgi:hypothetical protein
MPVLWTVVRVVATAGPEVVVKARKPMRRTELKRGDSQLKRTELRRGRSLQPKRSALQGSAGSAKPNGPVKARIESSEIPKAIRRAVYARDEWTCQRCGIYIPDSGRNWCLQHRDPRGMGGSRMRHTLPNLVLVCGWTLDAGSCTRWMEIEDRPAATALGWLVPNGAVPEEWPVHRFGTSWEQPGDIWVPGSPHPDQIELGAVA